MVSYFAKFAATGLLFATALAAPFSYEATSELEFNIITSNVRVDTKTRFAHEHAWSERKYGQIETLKEQSAGLPTLIGLQELKKNQLDDVLTGLNNDSTYGNWTYFGVGRDNGKEKGEYAAIIYNTADWELVNGTYKWLSETPDVPSKSWNASNIRIVTITEFRNLKTNQHLNYLNTHYDQTSEEARQHSSELISGWIKEIPNDYQTFLSGDFNSIDTDLSYTTLVEDLADTRVVAYNKLSQEPTYTGFEPGDNQTVIDFIWYPINTNEEGARTFAEVYNVIDNWTPEGFRFSDHRPVVVKFKIW